MIDVDEKVRIARKNWYDTDCKGLSANVIKEAYERGFNRAYRLMKPKEPSKAQEPIEARLHLCESCKKQYPECDATKDGVAFGSGTGNDNIIGCSAYVNRWVPQNEPRVMALSDVCNLKKSTPVWLEDIDKKDVICALFIKDFVDTKCVGFSVPYKWYFKRITADYIDYGIRWRCWDKEPTDEQREATPWTQTNGL